MATAETLRRHIARTLCQAAQEVPPADNPFRDLAPRDRAVAEQAWRQGAEVALSQFSAPELYGLARVLGLV